MIKVKTLFEWNHDRTYTNNVIKRVFNNNDLIWKNLQFVDTNDADFFVLFGNPTINEHNFYIPEKSIYFQTEPYQTEPKGKLFRNFSLKNGGWSVFPSWYMNLDRNSINKSFEKNKILSGIISNKNELPGQKLRRKFAEKVLDNLPYYSHFGRGMSHLKTFKGSPVCKSQSLQPYLYHFNAENIKLRGWITEKIIDPILMECLPFFDGCPDIDKYINPGAFIRIDLNNFNESKETIEKCIKDNEREKRLPYILEEKQKWLNEMLWTNIVWKIIHEKL